MEAVIGVLMIMVAIVGFVGWGWITVTAFSEGEAVWGVGCLIFFPIALVYGIMNFAELKIPVILLAVGAVGRIGLAALAIAAG